MQSEPLSSRLWLTRILGCSTYSITTCRCEMQSQIDSMHCMCVCNRKLSCYQRNCNKIYVFYQFSPYSFHFFFFPLVFFSFVYLKKTSDDVYPDLKKEPHRTISQRSIRNEIFPRYKCLYMWLFYF